MTPIAPSFNLLDEPWIRVIRLDGTSDEVSLLTVFREATDISGIHGEIASQDVAIQRLLLAICHRAMGGPEEMDVWEEYWDDPGKLGRDAAAYLEGYRDRFYLRHPEHPFFQVAGIHAASGKTSGLESLIVDVPNGDPFFTTRIAQGLEYISWSEAARWLVHVHAFDPSGIRSGAVDDPQAKNGKGYPIGPGWTGQIGVVTVDGENLERTLLLNTVVCEKVDGLHDVDPAEDIPPWERDPDGPAGSLTLEPTGPVSCYTWQTRRVLLHGDDARVTGLFLGNGDKATPHDRVALLRAPDQEAQGNRLHATQAADGPRLLARPVHSGRSIESVDHGQGRRNGDSVPLPRGHLLLPGTHDEPHCAVERPHSSARRRY